MTSIPRAAVARGGLGTTGLLIAGTIAMLVILTVTLVLAAAVSTGDVERYAVWLVGATATAGTVAAAAILSRRHRDEPWLFRYLVGAFLLKVAGSTARYFVYDTVYDRAADAARYHGFGVRFVQALEAGAQLPELGPFSQGTRVVAELTGWVYVLIGPDARAGFLFFAVAAFWGAYLWYRAAVTSVPEINRRLLFVLLAVTPSIVFWPASVGKEAPMMLAMGITALGVSRILTHHPLKGAAIAAGGVALVVLIRPHLAALLTVSAIIAYVLGRRTSGSAGAQGLRMRRVLAGILLVAATAFTVNAALERLGIESLTVEAVEARLDRQAEKSTQGGSAFGEGDASLSPAGLVTGLVTLLFRPTIIEAGSSLERVSALENLAVFGLILFRWRSLSAALAQSRRRPFLLFCLAALLFYAVALSSFGNFGLLMRQRSLILPAVMVLVAMEPERRRRELRESNRGAADATPALSLARG